MSNLTVKKTEIADVICLTPRRFGDARGWFAETYSTRAFADLLGGTVFVQDNQAFSAQKGTLRGLHFQKPPFAETKLFRVTRGAMFDVIVDLRPDSPTLRQWVSVELSEENGLALYVPRGMAHGFVTLREATEVSYQISTGHVPDAAQGVRFDDPLLGIAWPDVGPLTMSDRDRGWPPLE